MSFQDFCTELQRRLPVTISGCCINARAVVGIDADPAGVTWDCPVNLPSLVLVETFLAARAVALKAVTVH